MSWGLFPSPVLRSVGLGHRFRGSIYEPKMQRKKLLVSVRWKRQMQDLEASLLNESFCFCELHMIEIGEEGEEFWRIEERGSRGKPSDVGWREGDDMVFGEHQGTMSRWTQLSLLSPVVSLSSLSVWVKMTNVWAMEILSNIFPCPSHSSLLVVGHCKPLGIETKEIVTLLGCHRGVNRTLPLDYDRAKRGQHRTSGKLPLGTGQW